MILHFITDDKFADYAIDQFSESIFHSVFVLITDSETVRFVSRLGSIEIIKPSSHRFFDLLQGLGRYNAIILHGLFWPWEEDVLKMVPTHVKVAWVFWGGDIYGRKDNYGKFLSNRSKCLLGIQRFKNRIRKVKQPSRYEIPFDLLKRIDYCLTDIPGDFAYAKQYLGTQIKELWYNYYSIEETFGDLAGDIVDGRNILVGNSCSIECNHLDGFRSIRSFLIKDSKIVVPLGYGESWLRLLLLKVGYYYFGRRFQPLLDFIPRSEYNTIIKSCSVAIMPHYRPQAFGNILTALWLGTRVYLSEKNVLYSYFKRLGAILFSIEKDFVKTNTSALLPLSGEQINQNRQVISALYSKEMMHRKNHELVEELDQ